MDRRSRHIASASNTKRILVALSATQILLGSLSLIVGVILALLYWTRLPTFAECSEIWCELGFICAGTAGVVCYRRSSANPNLILLHIVLSVAAAILAVILIVDSSSTFLRVHTWPHILLLVFSVIETGVAVASTVLSCKAIQHAEEDSVVVRVVNDNFSTF